VVRETGSELLDADDHFWREAQAGSACLCLPLARRLPRLGRPAGGPFGRSFALLANPGSAGESPLKTLFGLSAEFYVVRVRARRPTAQASSCRPRQGGSAGSRSRCPRPATRHWWRCRRTRADSPTSHDRRPAARSQLGRGQTAGRAQQGPRWASPSESAGRQHTCPGLPPFAPTLLHKGSPSSGPTRPSWRPRVGLRTLIPEDRGPFARRRARHRNRSATPMVAGVTSLPR
jgi:hypothetical protein